MEKKNYVEPEVTKVEFEFSEVIAASGACTGSPSSPGDSPIPGIVCFNT